MTGQIHYAYREITPEVARRGYPLQAIQDEVLVRMVREKVRENQPLTVEVRWETRPRTQTHSAPWMPIDRIKVGDLPPTYEARCLATGREVSMEECTGWT